MSDPATDTSASSDSSDSSDRHQVADACRYFDSWLAFQREFARVPGVQAAVLHDGDVVLSTAHGVSALDSGESLTPRHLFRIASHSKTFTATAIMQLAEREVLRLDDVVGEWLPELATAPSAAVAAVTLRELLSHAGGVTRDGVDGDFWQLSRDFPDRAELLRIAADHADVLPRNDRFKYSNIGFSLLGLVVEAASGQPYNAYVAEHVVGRLGLVDTGPELDDARLGEYAAGHSALSYASERRTIDHVDTRAMASATGCYSTASDLVRYMAAHFPGDDRLVSDDSKRMMQRVEWAVEGTETSYGLGFGISEIGSRRVLGHGGGYPGHITRTFFDPRHRIAVSVFTNAIDGPAEAWATAAFHLIDLATRDDRAREQRRDLADVASFTGRFANVWGVYDVVDLGGRLWQIGPTQLDPKVGLACLEVVDADTLRITEAPGYGSPGELLRYTRADDGSIVSVRGGSGMTATPITSFRDSLSRRPRVSLGDSLHSGYDRAAP